MDPSIDGSAVMMYCIYMYMYWQQSEMEKLG